MASLDLAASVQPDFISEEFEEFEDEDWPAGSEPGVCNFGAMLQLKLGT